MSSLTIDDQVSQAGSSSIVHINGSMLRVSPANLAQGLILTEQSYASNEFVHSEWFNFFLKDLRAARAIFFVGYSLRDLDIQKALIADLSLTRKSFISVSPKADEIELESLARYGTVFDGGIDPIFDSVEEVQKSYKSEKFKHTFVALREINIPEPFQSKIPAAEILKNQLVYGRLPEKEVLLQQNVYGDRSFLVNRRQDRDVIDAFHKGPWRDLLIIGEIASGKTSSALNISSTLIEQGYRVFYATRSDRLNDELNRLARSDEKTVVIFEGYGAFRSEIREFSDRRKPGHRMILTERTVIHELTGGFLEEVPHLGPLYESSLDRIYEEDISHFEALVNFGGFWGDRAGLGEGVRQSIIRNQLESSLYKLLIEIIQSEKVQGEIRLLLEPVSFDRRALKLFVSSFIVNVMNLEFSINDWQSVFESQWVRRTMRNYKEQVRHFLKIEGDTIFPRSGVLSAHLLRTFADDELVGECLVKLYERAVKGSADDKEFHKLHVDLMKYSSLEPIFTSMNKSNNIFKYYDDIRIFGNTRNNSDYWLQMGIAATIHDDLSRAERAFENAYAREKSKDNPNLVKIDNYFSRFEMRKAIHDGDPQTAFNTFLVASERLKKQIFLEETRHYPFKTGRYFSDIAAKHYADWDDSQKNRFVKEAKEIRLKAINWKAERNMTNVDVELLLKETTRLLKSIEVGEDHNSG